MLVKADGTKQCTRCNAIKAVSAFGKDVHFRDGVKSECKACYRARAVVRRQWYKKNPQIPPSEKRCPYCEHVKAITEFGSNPGTKDGKTQYCKPCMYRYSHERKDKATWWHRHCFGAKRGISSKAVTPSEVKALFDADPFCTYCRLDMRTCQERVHVDHKQPKSREGTDHISNLAIACEDCNRMKHDHTELEFRIFLKEYVARFAPQPNPIRLYSLSEYAAKEAQA